LKYRAYVKQNQIKNSIKINTKIIINNNNCYLPASSVNAEAAAEAATSRKEIKYSDLPASLSFQPIAVETLGPINESAVDFLRELGHGISSKFQERQPAYLLQRLSVSVQRFKMQLSCTAAFHQVRTSGHQWLSF